MGEVELRYTAELVRGEGLVLAAEVYNDLDDPVWLATPLVEIGEHGIAVVEDRSYVYLDPDGVLQITRRLWPVPDDVDVYMPEVPRFTRLDPGERWRERLALPVPVDIRFPYRSDGEEMDEAPSRAVTGESFGVAFSVGYLVGQEAPGEAAPEGKGRVMVGYAAAAAGQRVVQGEVVGLRVGVRDVERESVGGDRG